MADGELRWAIVGVGTAGFARAKAIQRDPRSTLAAVWRGRRAEETGAPAAASLREAIAAADAVAVCSPDALHPEQVRAALQAGRHVVCEYPLAPTAAEAASLFALARTAGRVLHVEHIELLTGTARALRGQIRAPIVRRVDVAFQGRGPAEAPGAELARKNIARLHRLVDVAGAVAAIEAVAHKPGRLTAKLRMASGAEATLTFEQSPYFARLTRLEVDDGETVWRQENGALWRGRTAQTLMEPAPLFTQDHEAAVARILDDAPPYVSEDRILHVLGIADALATGRAQALH